MEWWQSILLGIVQGLTEFLPVSSSGHLMIFKELLGVDACTGLLRDIILGHPDKQFLLTVSPIRHLGDGAHANTISKATLHLAVDNVLSSFAAGGKAERKLVFRQTCPKNNFRPPVWKTPPAGLTGESVHYDIQARIARLAVDFQVGDGCFTDVYLTGPAEEVFSVMSK